MENLHFKYVNTTLKKFQTKYFGDNTFFLLNDLVPIMTTCESLPLMLYILVYHYTVEI